MTRTVPDRLLLLNGHVEWRGRRVRRLTAPLIAFVHVLAGAGGKTRTFRERADATHGVGHNLGDRHDGPRVNIRQMAHRVTRAFKDVDPDFDRIEAIRNVGYRWRVQTTGTPDDSSVELLAREVAG
jgi:hypothetical protein